MLVLPPGLEVSAAQGTQLFWSADITVPGMQKPQTVVLSALG